MTQEEIIAKHEALKKKGMRLSEQDALDWLGLYDVEGDIITEMESQLEEQSIDLKLQRGKKAVERADKYSNATKLNLALDVEFIKQIKENVILEIQINGAKRKYSSLGKYHDMAKKIIYK